jgi:hypothetical protein
MGHLSPLGHLLLYPDKGGEALVWFVEGTPSITWQSGEYYEKSKPAALGSVSSSVSSDMVRDLEQLLSPCR